MFHEDDPRTYAVPVIRTLETLQNINPTPLSDTDAQDTLTEIENTLTDTFDNVETTANITGDDIEPDNRYLPTYHMTDADLARWVEYNATYGSEETEYGERARVELELLVGATGEKYVRATCRPKPLGQPARIYAGNLNDFTLTEAATAATNVYGSETRVMASDGLSGSEIMDFRQLDFHGLSPENWAATRGVTYEAVRKTRESAREQLQDANWADELTEKPTETVDDLYNNIIDEHGDTIDAATEEIVNALPENLQNDDIEAALRVTVIETFAPSMHFGDTSVPQYELFLHKLGEMPLNAENHARKVRMLTDYGAMDIEDFRQITNTVSDQLNGAFDTDQQLDELTA